MRSAASEYLKFIMKGTSTHPGQQRFVRLVGDFMHQQTKGGLKKGVMSAVAWHYLKGVSKAIFCRHEKILLRQGRLQAQTQQNYIHVLVSFHSYIWINVFVWARALCGTRIRCCDSVDYNGAIRKIHERKFRLDQAFVT